MFDVNLLRYLLLLFKVVPFLADQVKIVVDNSVEKDRVEIDAIRLIGKTLPKGKIVMPPSTKPHGL